MVVALRYIGYLFMMIVMFFLARRTNSVIGACMLGILLFVLPLVFAYLQIPGLRYVLLNPLVIGNVF